MSRLLLFAGITVTLQVLRCYTQLYYLLFLAGLSLVSGDGNAIDPLKF